MEWYLAADAPPTLLRHEIRSFLERHAADPDGIDTSDLIVAELLANVIRHARTGAWVELTWADESPTLTVRDVGPGFSNHRTDPPPPFAEAGRGLWMVSRLSDDFRVSLRRHAGAAATARLPVRRKPERSAERIPVRFSTGPPVVLSDGPDEARTTFLLSLVVRLAQLVGYHLPATADEDAITQIGFVISQHMEAGFRERVDADGTLSQGQVADSLVWLKAAIGGDFYLIDVDEDRAILGNRRCPFGDAVRGAPALCRMTSSVFGAIAARNHGRSAVVLEERIAIGDPECRVTVWFREPPAHLRPYAHVYDPNAAAENE